MKVLFVCSGNNKYFGIAPFISSQAESLKYLDIKVSFFKVENKGIRGYLIASWKLRKHLNRFQYDIIHAHYTFNGLVALLAFKKTPIVVSYMGSDTYGDYNKKGKKVVGSYINIVIAKFIQPFINSIIVKSPNLAGHIYTRKKMSIIPNGIDLTKFYPIAKQLAKDKLELNKSKTIVLFLGDKSNYRKNYMLANSSFLINKGNNNSLQLLCPYPVDQDKLVFFLNAADVIILTSYNEGSPNIIKEAMACCKPIVSTNVGDVEWLFGDEPGHFIAGFDAFDFSEKLKLALDFTKIHESTSGKKRLLELGLDSESIAKRIISVYKSVLNVD